MNQRQRGAALLILFVVLITLVSGLVLGAARAGLVAPLSREARQHEGLALARDALLGVAQETYCADVLTPVDTLLPCPDSGGVEGEAAPACPGVSRGWLPWKTLNLPPLIDASGTCLWYERSGSTARVIAAGAPGAGQARGNLAGRPVCGGNHSGADYLDPSDLALSLALDAATLVAMCGP